MTEAHFDNPAKAHAIKLLVAVVLVAIGIYLTLIEFMGQEWLTRAGCLVVMLGIWSALGGIVEERLLSKRIRRKKRNAIISARARLLEQSADAEDIETEVASISEGFDAQLAHAAEKLRLSLGLQEVSLLLSGTFIWGFGDLLCC